MKIRHAVLTFLIALLFVGCGGSGGDSGGSGNPQSGTYGIGVRYFFGSLRLLDDDVASYTVRATLEQTGEQVVFQGSNFTLGNALGYEGQSVIRFSGANDTRDFDVTIALPTENLEFSGVELDVAVSVETNELELEKVEIYTADEQDTVKDKVKRKPKDNQSADTAIDDLVSGTQSNDEPKRGEKEKARPTDKSQSPENSSESSSLENDIMEEGIL